MTPQPVEVVTISGDAIAWLKSFAVMQLAFGVVLTVCVVALLVVVMWRGH